MATVIHWPIDERAVALIKYYESLHDGDLRQIGLQPKPDPIGIWTAGWGRALRDPDTGRFLTLDGGSHDRAEAYRQCAGLDEAGADLWLAEDLQETTEDVLALVSVPLSEPELGALVSFVYNCGIGNFNGSTLRKLLNAGKYREAADQFRLWVKSRGKVLPGLVKRRKAERDLFMAAR
jgi:lysozyme